MHELSIVMGIVDIAREQAELANATIIEEIEIEIGCLSSVEMNAFEFAWRQGIKNTPLENTLKKINRIPGEAKCMDCDSEFPIENLFDACPACGEHLIQVLKGKELRVKSLVIS
jgi:hydrogenase nickel incorporation protein HypA/HybF